jgi:hypothetical protein
MKHQTTFHNRLGMTVRTLMSAFAFFCLMASSTSSYSQMPVITVRFANPQFDNATDQYCVDVEFLSDVPEQQVFGMNVRFFYDDSVLEFISFTDFQGGYGPMLPNPPGIFTSPAGPTLFNFAGDAEFVNGAIQLLDETAAPVTLGPDNWTKVFQMCFHVDDANADQQNFCPSLVWDLEVNPENGSFLVGSDGVVITVVDPGPYDSAPSIENADQFNWTYSGSGAAPYGEFVANNCLALASWLSMNCIEDATIECDASSDPSSTGSATATDNCEGDVSVTYSDQIVAGSCANEQIILRTWIATNGCNATSTCVQMINVVDTKAPVISGVPEMTCIGDPAINQIAATDNCGSATLTYTESSVPHPSGKGKAIKRTYTSTDACGNSSTASMILLRKNECGRSFDINETEEITDTQLDNRTEGQLEINSRSSEVTGELNELNVWPNPASDNFQFGFTATGEYLADIQLINAHGKSVMTDQLNTVTGYNTVQLEVAKFPAGTYVMVVTTKNERHTKVVFIVEGE